MKNKHKPLILLIGGEQDANIQCLVQAGTLLDNITCIPILVGAKSDPDVSWDINSDILTINGQKLHPDGVFIRCDVFSSMTDPRGSVSIRAQRWFTTLWGYAMAHDTIRILNREAGPLMGNKPAILKMAQECGLAIPTTLVTNNLKGFVSRDDIDKFIVKPVNGGDLCRELSDTLNQVELRDGIAACPAIIQNKLSQPEIRVYRIGDTLIAYNMLSDSLDYREKQDARVSLFGDTPPKQAKGLIKLMDQLNMDFGAADFKTDPVTGDFVFLEVNSSPMFARFNFESSGILAQTIIGWLATAQTETRKANTRKTKTVHG